jgi:uncharacterized protein (TIGR02246 family)
MMGTSKNDQRTQPERTADEAAIRALHGQVLDGWNSGDGAAFAAPFRPDAHFVAFDGSVTRGREQIAETHQVLFDKWLAGSRLTDERTEVRFLAPDTAMLVAVGGTIMRGKSEPAPERDSIQTLVTVRDESGWSLASFHNTRIRPIGSHPVAALLWLVPDLLWRLFYRLTRTTPRTRALGAK